MQAGSIRADMFQQLLVADIVVADISIHNANVFYELGIRHALQPMRTFLLRAKTKTAPKDRTAEDEVPFDLKTDRYLDYDSDHPGDRLQALIDGLQQTLASEKSDSPVFQMLPDLEGQDRSRFLPVPRSFHEDVETASRSKSLGLLSLLALEAQDFFWASEGLRLVGRAQFDLKAYSDAKFCWEELYKLNPMEPEANQRLGTIYQTAGGSGCFRSGIAPGSEQQEGHPSGTGGGAFADRAQHQGSVAVVMAGTACGTGAGGGSEIARSVEGL